MGTRSGWSPTQELEGVQHYSRTSNKGTLRERDNLPTEDEMADPKVSFIRRFRSYLKLLTSDLSCNPYIGLHLFAEGLSDFRDALVQCNETELVKILVKFIEDLVACTEGVGGMSEDEKLNEAEDGWRCSNQF